jgi:transcriptional regulator with XRE-family HTH domain
MLPRWGILYEDCAYAIILCSAELTYLRSEAQRRVDMARESAVVNRRLCFGAWLRRARLEADRSLAGSAAALSCSTKVLSSFENGQKSPTLPQIEALAELYRVPVSYFWQCDLPPEGAPGPEGAPELIRQRLLLRQKLIGVQLRQARQCAGKSVKEAAAVLGSSSHRINQYECGEREMPIAELETLAHLYGSRLEDFVLAREVKPAPAVVTAAASSPAAATAPVLRHLSSELAEFVGKPTNTLYLEVALRLSRLSAADLRAVAESLLEITY